MKLLSFVLSAVLVTWMFSACNGQEIHTQVGNAKCPDMARIVVDRSSLFPDSLMARDLQLTGLENLRHGFRDFQLRIWKQTSHSDKFQVFALKQVGDAYQAWLYEYQYQFKESSYIPIGVSKQVQEVKAKISWAELRERLAISQLFEQADIDDQSNDQSGASIELSTCERYKIFFQPVYNTNAPNNNAVERLLAIIEKEFGVVWQNKQ